MFIPLKYKDANNSSGQILWCRYCATRFVIPVKDALSMITVCDNPACKDAHSRGEIPNKTKTEEIKAEQAKIINGDGDNSNLKY